MSEWMSFLESRVINGKSPFAYPRIWIWRSDWTNGPQALNAHDMHPATNVDGLLWKPYDEADRNPLINSRQPEKEKES